MKRPLLILLGAIVILILLGIWVYVLLTGDQDNTDRFAAFNLGDTTDTSVEIAPEEPDEPVVNVTSPNALRQLTTEPVAGFTEVRATATSTGIVHYIEAGTGHIMTINLDTGEEERVSATTIPVTTKGVITPDGSHVLIQAGQGAAAEFIIGTVATSSDELSNFALNEQVTSFAASVDNRLLYSAIEGGNTVAKVYNPETNTTQTLFSMPLRDVTIDWHHTVSGPHLVYPKTASLLEGFVYSFTNGALTRLPISGYGLSAAGSAEIVINSKISNGNDYNTEAYIVDQAINQNLPLDILPEKCADSPSDSGFIVCASDQSTFSNLTTDAWYRGTTVSNDQLWDVQAAEGTMNLLVNIQTTSGQTVDVVTPQFNLFGSHLYFQNKIDNTLWVYDFTI